jgi:hypothetical protein
LTTSVWSSLNVHGAPSLDCGRVLECNIACGPTWLPTVPIYVNTDHSQ